MRFEAAIFDYDGVLVELDREKAVSLFRGRAPLPVRTLHQRWEVWCSDHIGETRSSSAMWRAFWELQARELGIPEPALEEICAVDCLSLFRLCPDTPAALRDARQLGLRIGVLSNSALPALESPFAPLDLASLADVVRVPARGVPIKPDREAYLDIARSLGVSPEYCLFFDNEPSYVEAARQVGMRAYLVVRGQAAPPDAAAVVADLTGIRALAAEQA
jgi:putative hydrolase of the HAD superfamily